VEVGTAVGTDMVEDMDMHLMTIFHITTTIMFAGYGSELSSRRNLSTHLK
jgi:hypothetical protein